MMKLRKVMVDGVRALIYSEKDGLMFFALPEWMPEDERSNSDALYYLFFVDDTVMVEVGWDDGSMEAEVLVQLKVEPVYNYGDYRHKWGFPVQGWFCSGYITIDGKMVKQWNYFELKEQVDGE